MEFVNLTEKEFEEFSLKHKYSSFYQTINWGKLKKENGWQMHLVGIKDNNKVVAASLILAKTTPIKKKMFYAPRGFLIDYSNKELLTFFTKEIKKYVKDNNGYVLKIDPYLDYKERDIDGNIVKDGIDNSDAVDNLINLGYKHFGFNMALEALQPRWIYTIPVKDKTIDELLNDMNRENRRVIKKNESFDIKVREIKKDEISKFKDVMQHTSDRRDFIDRPYEYYLNMWNHLHDSGIIKIMIAELDAPSFINNLKKEKEQIDNNIKDRQYKKENNILAMNEKKYEQNQKDDKIHSDKLAIKIKEIEAAKDKYGDCITLGSVLFFTYGNEVLALVGGSYDEFKDFQAPYTIYWEMIKYTKEQGYDRYNFYGITGDFTKENPLYGLYLFKRGFGGRVNELIGEFDLIIDKPAYALYKTAFPLYKKTKNIVNKILRKHRK